MNLCIYGMIRCLYRALLQLFKVIYFKMGKRVWFDGKIRRGLTLLSSSVILTKLYVGIRNFVHGQRFAEISSYY